MPGRFEDETLADALERAIKNAKHLRAKDAAAVMAARELARKIDEWDTIVRWAQKDAEEHSRRPAVPAHDNVTPETFRKYLEMLGLAPEKPTKKPTGETKRARSRVDVFIKDSKKC